MSPHEIQELREALTECECELEAAEQRAEAAEREAQLWKTKTLEAAQHYAKMSQGVLDNLNAYDALKAQNQAMQEALEEMVFMTEPDTFGGSLDDARTTAKAVLTQVRP